MRHLFWTWYEEVWWWLEKWAARLWLRLSSPDVASYWLDFLPAFCLRERYRGQNNRVRLETTQIEGEK